MSTRKINIPGMGPTEVVEVGFRPLAEHWNEYLLDDGTTIRLKGVVTVMYRVVDQYDDDGNPAYIVNSTNVAATKSPDAMRKPKTEEGEE